MAYTPILQQMLSSRPATSSDIKMNTLCAQYSQVAGIKVHTSYFTRKLPAANEYAAFKDAGKKVAADSVFIDADSWGNLKRAPVDLYHHPEVEWLPLTLCSQGLAGGLLASLSVHLDQSRPKGGHPRLGTDCSHAGA